MQIGGKTRAEKPLRANKSSAVTKLSACELTGCNLVTLKVRKCPVSLHVWVCALSVFGILKATKFIEIDREKIFVLFIFSTRLSGSKRREYTYYQCGSISRLLETHEHYYIRLKIAQSEKKKKKLQQKRIYIVDLETKTDNMQRCEFSARRKDLEDSAVQGRKSNLDRSSRPGKWRVGNFT